MRRRIAGLAVAVVVAASPGCRKKIEPVDSPETLRTKVTLENTDPQTNRRNSPWRDRVFPPFYSEAVLPEYPAEAVEARITPARVRLDFTVSRAGHATNIRATVLEGIPMADHFATAAEKALLTWRFSPAWRLAESAGTDPPIETREFPTHLVFRFDLESDSQQGSLDAAPEG